jgi:hypothetical protein
VERNNRFTCPRPALDDQQPVEGLADLTPEQLEEVPGIGEKTLEKIGAAVRHYFAELDKQADAGPMGAPSSEAEDTNEAAMDKQAGAGMNVAAEESTSPAEAAGNSTLEPGEIATLDAEQEMAEGSLTVDADAAVAGAPEPGDGHKAETLAQNALRNATGTEDPQATAYVEAPALHQPELERWEEKEKP